MGLILAPIGWNGTSSKSQLIRRGHRVQCLYLLPAAPSCHKNCDKNGGAAGSGTHGLPVTPLRLTRSISLTDHDQLLLEYEIENLGNEAEEFVWTWHPLFNFGPGREERTNFIFKKEKQI